MVQLFFFHQTKMSTNNGNFPEKINHAQTTKLLKNLVSPTNTKDDLSIGFDRDV